MKRAALAIVFLLINPSIAAHWRAEMSVSPAVSLPGLPVTTTITLTNDSRESLAPPAHFAILARRSDGSAFVVRCGGLVQSLDPLRAMTVPPGCSVAVPGDSTGAFDVASCTTDPRLQMPGVYELAAHISDSYGHRVDLDAAKVEALAREATVIARTTLTIQEPRGEDAVVWQLMSALPKSGWTSHVIGSPAYFETARRVVTEFPRSLYAGWFAATGVSRDYRENARVLRHWLRSVPRDQYADARWENVIRAELALASEHGAINPEARDEYAKRALATAREIADPVRRDALLEELRQFLRESQGSRRAQ